MINPEKYDMLLHWLGRLENAAVAFSGGVDSTFVLAAARLVHGDKVLALTVKTPYIPDWELNEAKAFCKENGIRHRIIFEDIIPEIMHNPENRCYLCKRHVFTLLKNIASQEGFVHVLDGTNADDATVYRPGLVALRELGIESPLQGNGITKEEVRNFSAKLGLKTAEKPSYACLLTRLPYHSEINLSDLQKIEKAEVYMASIGYWASRVRHHGNIARIEMDRDRITEFVNSGKANKVVLHFHKLGYEFVTIDLEGYRSGSFDKQLNH